MRGRILKGIAGFYYVDVPEFGLYECKAKGAFRKAGVKPLVGDFVDMAVIDEEKKVGNVEKILTRKNELIRPAVSNVDQAMYIFSVTKPKPNLNLLDRFLGMMEYQDVPTVIVINKVDLDTDGETDKLKSIYESAGYQVITTSMKSGKEKDELWDVLKGKTTTVAGPSGVGKSTFTNLMHGTSVMETGSISEKIQRGKNTTRHSQCLALGEETYLMDTPGFGSMLIPEIEKEDLSNLFREFREYSPRCRFQGCAHIHEPDCEVKRALEDGKISRSRYDNYLLLYEEVKNRKKY